VRHGKYPPERAILGCSVLLLVACGGTDSTSFGRLQAQGGGGAEVAEMKPAAGAPAAQRSAHITTVANTDGSFASTVDAASEETWVYLSLDTHAEVTPDDPAQSTAWDLGFQRFNVKLNGGVSGSAGASVAIASGSFDDVLTPPADDGFLEDSADADMDGNPDYAFGAGDGWYEYDPASHTLSARDTVFVVKTASGAYVKLQFSSYYDAAGTPGMPQFRWAPLGGS
jgi:hypothetical protein